MLIPLNDLISSPQPLPAPAECQSNLIVSPGGGDALERLDVIMDLSEEEKGELHIKLPNVRAIYGLQRRQE